MKKRFCISSFVIMFGFLILISKIFFISNDMEYREASARQSSMLLNAAKTRGTIYDKNFKPITNENYIFVAAVIPCTASADALYKALPLERHAELQNKLKSMMPFTIEVPTDDIYAEGVDVFSVPALYSESQCAVHLIGECDNSNNGISGIQKCYDKLLKSFGGFVNVRYKADALHHVLKAAPPKTENTLNNSKGGIVLTIDKKIQIIAEKASKNIEKGAVVVMDCHTGDILAAVSRPNFNIKEPQKSFEDKNSPFINRAFLPFSVGSTFKLLTAATALEQGVTWDKTYYCGGNIEVGENIFNCHKLSGHGELDMHEALKKSCNTYFISLGINTGGQNLLFKAKKLGFGSQFLLAPDMITESGNLPTKEDLLSDAATANFAFGQGVLTATPVQIAVLISAMANGGNAVTPRIIEGTTADGVTFLNHTARFSPQNVFLPSAVDKVRRMMVEVVESGSGVKANPENFGAGGKTASAQSGQFVQGAEVVHAWFSGFYPAENPQYSIVVLYEAGDSGGDMACPVFKEICDSIGTYNIPNSTKDKISAVNMEN